MSATAVNRNPQIDRAKTLAAMGMVERDYDGFNVSSPGVKKEVYRVWRDETGRARCSCPDYQAQTATTPRYRCEHILAVKFYLEPPDDPAEPSGEDAPDEPDQQAVSETGQLSEPDPSPGIALPFAETLKELSQAVSPDLIRQRVGWTDPAGNEHEVDYVEWHTVADLLDRICPNWSHEVTSIKQIGDFVAVTASITILGVTRQGVGTGSAYDEKGIKKAEHDALKRAAVKFGIARELYRKEEEAVGSKKPLAQDSPARFPRDPVARTMAALVTPKQLVAIRAIANAQGLNAEILCVELLKCRPEELSRRAASSFIDYMKATSSDSAEVRKAG